MTDVGKWDLFSTPLQGLVQTHGPDRCVGVHCCVHNPSDHHMRDWPLVFRFERYGVGMRVCLHGYAHPDPDGVVYMLEAVKQIDVDPKTITPWLFTHECDMCCHADAPAAGPAVLVPRQMPLADKEAEHAERCPIENGFTICYCTCNDCRDADGRCSCEFCGGWHGETQDVGHDKMG